MEDELSQHLKQVYRDGGWTVTLDLSSRDLQELPAVRLHALWAGVSLLKAVLEPDWSWAASWADAAAERNLTLQEFIRETVDLRIDLETPNLALITPEARARYRRFMQEAVDEADRLRRGEV